MPLFYTDSGCSILATKAHTPERGAVFVFFFLAGVLVGYYLYSTVLFGFFPRRVALAWGLLAILSPFPAYMLWFGGGRGIIASILVAIPVGFLVQQGSAAFYTASLVHAFDLLLAVLLWLIVPHRVFERLVAAPVAVVIALLVQTTGLISLLVGGL